MNIIAGIISNIETDQNLSLVTIQTQGFSLTAVVIDTPKTASYLNKEQPINVLFKETEVILAQDQSDIISLRNQIPGIITKIQSSQILSKVTLQTKVGAIISIITTKAVKALKLEVGSKATAMIKTNEVMLSV